MSSPYIRSSAPYAQKSWHVHGSALVMGEGRDVKKGAEKIMTLRGVKHFKLHDHIIQETIIVTSQLYTFTYIIGFGMPSSWTIFHDLFFRDIDGSLWISCKPSSTSTFRNTQQFHYFSWPVFFCLSCFRDLISNPPAAVNSSKSGQKERRIKLRIIPSPAMGGNWISAHLRCRMIRWRWD